MNNLVTVAGAILLIAAGILMMVQSHLSMKRAKVKYDKRDADFRIFLDYLRSNRIAKAKEIMDQYPDDPVFNRRKDVLEIFAPELFEK